MAPIKKIEHFRVKPRWLFVKITDDEGKVGWGEGTLEGHDLAVEGALDEIIVRLISKEAKSVQFDFLELCKAHHAKLTILTM